jgi:hypothetical protein
MGAQDCGHHSRRRRDRSAASDSLHGPCPLLRRRTDHVWGVIDFVPDTDFPHIRTRASISSPLGSALIIPREEEKVRFYVQLDPHKEFFDGWGRFDMGQVSANRIVEVSNSFQSVNIPTDDDYVHQLVSGYLKPWTLKMRGSPEWWSAYRGKALTAVQSMLTESCSSTASCDALSSGSSYLHCRRCVSLALAQRRDVVSCGELHQ